MYYLPFDRLMGLWIIKEFLNDERNNGKNIRLYLKLSLLNSSAGLNRNRSIKLYTKDNRVQSTSTIFS